MGIAHPYDKGDSQEVEGVKVEDNKGHGYRPNVEDSAGEEEGEERAEGLDELDLLLQRLFHLLATGCRLLLLFDVVEGEQLCTDLDHNKETHLHRKTD